MLPLYSQPDDLLSTSTEQEGLINQEVAKHEASHLLIADLFYGHEAVKALQLWGHAELPPGLVSNCCMNDWFSLPDFDHIGIPTLIAGVISEELAGTPFYRCQTDLEQIAIRKAVHKNVRISEFVTLVYKVLSDPKVDAALDTMAMHIVKRVNSGAKSIQGKTLHKMFSDLIGPDYECSKPTVTLVMHKQPRIIDGIELVVAMHKVFCEIRAALPPSFKRAKLDKPLAQRCAFAKRQ